MRKNKFVYTLSALLMACIISFSGVGGTYLQASAKNDFADALWNDNASTADNLKKYFDTFMNYMGAFVEPTIAGEIYAGIVSGEFAAWMLTEGYTEDVVHDVMCGGDHTHESCSGYEHGGGGFVRDGISVDDDGNVTYSDEVSDLFHGYIQDYLDSNSGYMVLSTRTASDIPASYFKTEEHYNNFKTTVNNFDIVHVSLLTSGQIRLSYIPTNNLYTTYDFSDLDFRTDGVYALNGTTYYLLYFQVLEDDWARHYPYYLRLSGSTSNYSDLSLDSSYSMSDLEVNTSKVHTNCTFSFFGQDSGKHYFYSIFTKDGRNVKLWNNLEAFKNYDVGYQLYYATQNWINYDASHDNSMTLTQQEYQYFNDNSSSMYQDIQNNIDNSTEEIDESVVNNIVNITYNQFIEESKGSGSGEDSGNGDNSGEDSGGNGIADLLTGIGKLFDTILSLFGKLMGVVDDFTTSILDLFSGFTTFTDGFSQFLAGAFGFIPAEIWNVIQVGLSLMVLAAIIKFLRK